MNEAVASNLPMSCAGSGNMGSYLVGQGLIESMNRTGNSASRLVSCSGAVPQQSRVVQRWTTFGRGGGG